ncbi:unnamed protein product [Triticum turgidum subsp. durum]|uniref:Late embryogenesis abundant protein LEA-2 subgroup domain-containing protein n=1 Tax=Triticum turgidum subsp. durum TaxID=4567 RepID=A0A9R1RQC4_TRITD|nr:unnamed protein product [Triticum turgidum subsp. durum]
MEKSDLEAGTMLHHPAVASRNGGKVFVYAFMIALSVSILLAFIVHVGTTPKQILLPTFSVNLDGFDGLQAPAPAISSTFNLSLHAVSSGSPQSQRLCLEGGSVAVSYAGAVLAWGRVPGFCVERQEQKHVRMVALGTEVSLIDRLRQRMTSELRELDVDMMLRGSAAVGRERRLLSCRLDMKSASSHPSMCKIYVYLVSQ